MGARLASWWRNSTGNGWRWWAGRRSLQAEGAGRLDRMDPRAFRRLNCQQHPLRAAAGPSPAHGLAGAGIEPAAVVERHAPAWASGAGGRDLRGPEPLCRHLLPGLQRLSLGMTRGYRRQPGGSARWSHHGQQGASSVPLATRCLPTTESTRRRPRGPARANRNPSANRLRSLFECLRESRSSASRGASADPWPPLASRLSRHRLCRSPRSSWPPCGPTTARS